ncbi:hypothetical protein [Roseimaritima sediminicola]|uniref:hypothetical protein n=1 Tax=Roseimaritima sediminicola TaxID=2662066 RepID=UPI0012982AB5|nr:hypothetical protein [Roseimaritima sediminicola]
MMRISLTILTAAALFCLPVGADEDAATAAQGKTIEVFDVGTITTPGQWKSVRPKVNIIQHEFAATSKEVDVPARVTMMAASGSVDANIDRWKGQFSIAGEDAVKQETKKLDGVTLHLVELDGTYSERMGGPFAGGRVVKREDYAMNGAILVDEKGRKFFIKMIGPAKVVKANREAFAKMVKGFEAK